MSGERAGPIISVASHFLASVADVPDHDRDDEYHDGDGNRRPSAEIPAPSEHPVEHEVGEYLALPLPVGHGEHDVEDLEDQNGDRRPDDGDRAPDLRDHDLEEYLEAIGT